MDREAGSVSVNPRLAIDVAFVGGLVIVILSVAAALSGTIAGLNAIVRVGGLRVTVSAWVAAVNAYAAAVIFADAMSR